MTKIYLILLLVMIGFATTNGQALYQSIELEYGKNQVGYNHTVETDRTRPYDRVMDYANTLTFRPMPISSWYPLKAEEDLVPVRISDYTRALKEEEEWGTLPDEYFFSWFYYPETSAGKANIGQPTRAFKGGGFLAGK